MCISPVPDLGTVVQSAGMDSDELPDWMSPAQRALFASGRPRTLRRGATGRECPHVTCRGRIFPSTDHVLTHLGEEHDEAGIWAFAGEPLYWVPALLLTPIDQSGGWVSGSCSAGPPPP